MFITLKCYRCKTWPCECADGITLIHGDCRKILPHLEPVDLVLTDPPYGIELESHGQIFVRDDIHVVGDGSQELGSEVLTMCWQMSLPQVVFSSPKAPWPGYWRQWLVWDKGPSVGIGGDRETCWKFDWEIIQVRLTPPLNGQRDTSVLRFHVCAADYGLHPCQKPVQLLNYLINKVPGTNILDPFAGSGTTLVAAKQLGRKCIGIEIEEKYCEIAANRLRQEVLPFND
jgi:DNA modification methylase